ncbi:hypothetical protein F5Y01DRAFT_299417 [Xylaria sp. FL0043]|nr:hypothetical protein F5Y01DRAFT_299417 [Xylaria sp. FL0043]
MIFSPASFINLVHMASVLSPAETFDIISTSIVAWMVVAPVTGGTMSWIKYSRVTLVQCLCSSRLIRYDSIDTLLTVPISTTNQERPDAGFAGTSIIGYSGCVLAISTVWEC